MTHRVTDPKGNVIHQHTAHVGKYGGTRAFTDEWLPPPSKPSHTIDPDRLLERLRSYIAEHGSLLPPSIRVDGPRIERRGGGGTAEVSCWFWVGTEPVKVIEILFRNGGIDLFEPEAVVADFEAQFNQVIAGRAAG